MKTKLIGAALLVLGIVIGRAWAAQDVPKKGYIIAQVDVTNPQQYGEYAKLSPGIIAKFGGRFLARAGRTVTLEGTPARSRVVIIEYPSFERAQAFFSSTEYQQAKKLREGAATAQFILVEGQ
ncbi:MAG TPA: DUF1330 domain-containing protein [Vicinamibacterales bacterium]|nr:DUF1330 domain-containing protein [Vicinamibacterales bacterium]